MTHKDYIDLFRNIANLHKSISHGRDGRKSFLRTIRSTGDPFEDKIYLEEFIRMNNKIHYPALVTMSYNHSYVGEQDQTPYKHINGLFCVINKKGKIASAEASKFDNLDEALDEAEEIAEDIISFIQDFAEKNNCDFLLMDPPEAEKTGPNTDDVVGQSVYFTLKKRTPLTLNSAKWHSPETI